MFNNRMLAVAAVLVMAVPALGAATPIVVPPVPEQLVEGHTVFTVIEIVRATTTLETRFAAAVAVLVREYNAERTARRFPGVLWFNDQYLVNPTQSRANFEAFRYPCGGSVIAVNAGDPDPRVAIARVTAGTPGADVDGANVVPANDFGAQANLGAPYVVGPLDGEGIDLDGTNYTYRASKNWWEPDPDYDGDGVDDPYYYGQDSGGPGDDPTDYAWVGAKPGDGTVSVDTDPAGNPGVGMTGNAVYSDTVLGALGGDVDKALLNATAPWDYDESYLITDPNDHSWVIDKYYFYTRDSVDGTNVHADDVNTLDPETFTGDRLAGSDNANNLETKTFQDPNAPTPSSEHFPTDTWGGQLNTLYEYPVWVVNILGSPVFIPDGGNAFGFAGEFIGENCMPFRDLLEDLSAPANGAACGLAVDNGNALGTGADTDLTLSPGSPVMPFTDDPCMGYMEPSRNGYCYGGQAATDSDLDGDVDKDDCLADRADGNQFSPKPLRLYNALLYFKLEDLRIPGADKDHSDPFGNTDTNGCSEEPHWWDTQPTNGYPNYTQYPCPGGDDDAEGNSHSFHPAAPVHEEREACIPEFAGPNPSNHGGSTQIAPGTRAGDDGWFDVGATCDYAHATRNIDIYFSPAGRPFPPVIRTFNVMDLEGSSAPFQDYHRSYP